jgi:hypothetical protein
MASTVKARPNHYETLGLKPTARDDEIKEAFARQMRLPHRMPEIAQIGIAFDTLRHPSKRRAYDEAMGLTARPQPRQWAFIAQARWAPIAVKPMDRAAATEASFLEPRAIAEPEPHITTAPEPKAPEPRLVRSLPEWVREPEIVAEAGEGGFEPKLPEFLTGLRAQAKRSRNADGHAVDWKYPLVAVGGVVLTVALLGAWAGMTAGSDVEAAQAAVTVALPKARPHPKVAAAAPAPVAETQPDWLDRAGSSASRIKRIASRQQPRAWAPKQVIESPAGESELAEAVPDPLAPEPTAAAVVAASMPLPNKVIAHTLERIGYACGEVSSAVAAEGARPGVYNITCSSGQTYQATPVHGRYRFRRSGGR